MKFGPLVQVRLRCQKGIPPALRGRTWLYLSGGKVKKEQNQGKFQVSQVSLSLLLLLLSFLISCASEYPSAFRPHPPPTHSLQAPYSDDTDDDASQSVFLVCSARSWIVSPGIPNGLTSSRKTCIGSFLFTKCSCHEEDTGRRLWCRLASGVGGPS